MAEGRWLLLLLLHPVFDRLKVRNRSRHAWCAKLRFWRNSCFLFTSLGRAYHRLATGHLPSLWPLGLQECIILTLVRRIALYSRPCSIKQLIKKVCMVFSLLLLGMKWTPYRPAPKEGAVAQLINGFAMARYPSTK